MTLDELLRERRIYRQKVATADIAAVIARSERDIESARFMLARDFARMGYVLPIPLGSTRNVAMQDLTPDPLCRRRQETPRPKISYLASSSSY